MFFIVTLKDGQQVPCSDLTNDQFKLENRVLVGCLEPLTTRLGDVMGDWSINAQAIDSYIVVREPLAVSVGHTTAPTAAVALVPVAPGVAPRPVGAVNGPTAEEPRHQVITLVREPAKAKRTRTRKPVDTE